MMPGRAALAALSILVARALPAQGTSATYSALELTAAEIRSDVALLRRALAHVHPGLTRYATKEQLDAAFARIPVRDGVSDVELYRAVSVACATIRCGHTRVMAPRIDAYRERNETQLPFTFRIFGEELVVETVAPDLDALQKGDRIERIEGEPAVRLIAEIGGTVCLDGFTDSVRASRLDHAYEFADSGFDHYLPAWIGFRSSFRLCVRRGGKSREVTVPAIGRAAWRALRPGARDFREATSVRMLDDETALLRVDTFVNYRKPVDPVARYERLFRKIREAGPEHLIVDLRCNGGGSDDATWALARFLVQEPFVPGLAPIVVNYRCPPELARHLKTWERGVWDRPASLFEKVSGGYEVRALAGGRVTPHPDRFRGRITVLTSRFNASGSTMLIAWLKQLGVRTVGERTGGAPRGPTAGLLFTLSLPASKLEINIPALRVRTGLDGYGTGRGVEPHVRVTEGLADFLRGNDPVLAAAR